jgi:hypothetical protein
MNAPTKGRKKHIKLLDKSEFSLPDPDKSVFFINHFEKAKAMWDKHPFPVNLLRSK